MIDSQITWNEFSKKLSQTQIIYSVDYALKLRFSVGTIERVLVCFWQHYYTSY